ncbi:MAG: DUF3467 domain-containing protein [candidate division WOR-3 bacterium]
MKEIPPPHLQIELPDNAWDGTYSNFVLITHSPSEFVFDFGRVVPGVQKVKVESRVIMTPQHAKLLLRTIEDNIKKYEARFGEIRIPGEEEGKRIGFVPQFSQEKPETE